MTSLRKKIHEHKSSQRHIQAVAILKKRSEKQLDSSLLVAQEEITSTMSVFRTAYYIAKRNKPFTEHPELTDLQRANGVNIGRVLHSNVTCGDIIQLISKEMKGALMASIMSTRPKLTILIDEGTALSKKSCLVVYLRCSVNNSEPTTFFLDLVELQSTNAEGITEALLNCLLGHGLDNAFLNECLVGFCSDGASVMLGRKAGVFSRLKSKFPRLISWHCLNHRLELAVGDAVKQCTEINHFSSFMDKLYCLYHQSPKNQRELSSATSELGIVIKKIGRVLSVRWVASSHRAVKAVWTMHEALYANFCKASHDAERSANERCMFQGLATKLSSGDFIKNMGLMLDALEELKDLSQSL